MPNAIALDKMLFPELVSKDAPADLVAFRQDALALFLDILNKYSVKGFENAKDSQIKPDMLLTHATSVAQQLALNSKEKLQAFASARGNEGKSAKKALLKVQDQMGMLDKIAYMPRLIAFKNKGDAFFKKNSQLVKDSGYRNVGALQDALVGVLQYLVGSYGKAIADYTPQAAGSSTESNGAGGVGNSAAGKKAGYPAWVIPSLVLGSVGIVATSVFVWKRNQPRKRARR